MFKGLDELKKKATQKAQTATEELAEKTEALAEEAKAAGEQAGSGLSDSVASATEAATAATDQATAAVSQTTEAATEAAAQAADSAAQAAADTADKIRRTAGKLKARWSEPETRVEKKLLKEIIYFICHDCRSELGPLELGKWKRFVKSALYGTAGALTGNPILLVKGVAGAAGTAAKGDKEPGMMAKLKGDSKRQAEAREYLVQGEYCASWYCSGCWVADKRICKECAGKAERGIELPRLGGFGSERTKPK